MSHRAMRRHRRAPLIAALVALGLTAAACGSDSSSSTTSAGATTTAPTAPTASGASPSTAGGATTAVGSTPMTDGGDTTLPSAGDDAAPLKMVISTEPSTLDAQAVNDRSSRIFTDNVYEALLFRSADGTIQPLLATSYENVDDNTWQLKLRDGVTFHDGEAFNADAVVFSIQRIISEDFNTQRTSYTDGITGATKVDDSTVDITTDGLIATLPAQLTQIPMVPPNAADKLDTDPIGTGPYKFVRWDAGSDIVATPQRRLLG